MKILTVGIPKEIKSKERRVALVPEHVRILTAAGIPVWVEQSAGALSGFTDPDYRKAGAQIAEDHAEIFSRAEIIHKVKEPLSTEFFLLRDKQIVFGFLHLASPANCDLAKTLLDRRVTAIGFETIVVNGQTPILKPMSEIAGTLAASFSGFFLKILRLQKGPHWSYPDDFHHIVENIAGKYPEPDLKFPIFRAVIYGGGVAGQKAAETARKLGAHVAVVEINGERIKKLKEQYARDPGIQIFSPKEFPMSVLEDAEVLIGCVHRAGERAEKVLDDSMLEIASTVHKKVMIDVAVDQGGNFPETRAVSYDDPLYLDSCGNLRFSVANIPSFCGGPASVAISSITWPYVKALAEGPDKAFAHFPELLAGINTRDGLILREEIRQAHRR